MTPATSIIPRMGRKRRPPPRGRTLRIRFARNLHRLAGDKTNREIAVRCGVSAMTVGRWFTAEDVPEMDLWPTLAKCLGCRIVDFFQE